MPAPSNYNLRLITLPRERSSQDEGQVTKTPSRLLSINSQLKININNHNVVKTYVILVRCEYNEGKSERQH